MRKLSKSPTEDKENKDPPTTPSPTARKEEVRSQTSEMGSKKKHMKKNISE